MYAVIFRATIKTLDDRYSEMAGNLRTLAMADFGCIEFISLTEGDQELAISYWPDEASIQRWKQDSDHLIAQQLGKKDWYQHYQVEVVEIKRRYASS